MTDTTPPPAQADEKDAADRLAALRPEGEAVAPFGYVVGANFFGEDPGALNGKVAVFASPPAPAGVKEALAWAMDEIDALSNRLCQFAYPQGMSMLDRADQLPNYEAAVQARSSLLPPSPEAQAAAPAEALPSQTSGAEPACWTSEASLKMAAQGVPAMIHAYPPPVEPVALYRQPLAKPASEPAGGGVGAKALPKWVYTSALALFDGDSNRVRAYHGSIHAGWEDTPEFETAETFYAWAKAECDRRNAVIAALSSPASSPAEAEALQDGVGIYIASKTTHGARWRALRASGVPIISTWIDEAEAGATSNWPDLWHRCVKEAAQAAATIVYREPGEVLKGAFVEMGAALAAGRTVFTIGCDEFSVRHHMRVVPCASLEEALDLARSALLPSKEQD